MADPTGIIGLIGLFTTCLEAYKICLAIKGADDEVKKLRTRMYLQKVRFQNIGKACGLVVHQGHEERTRRLQRFLDEDELRRRAVNDTLELIASFLLKAESLDRKYEPQGTTPDILNEKVRILLMLRVKL